MRIQTIHVDRDSDTHARAIFTRASLELVYSLWVERHCTPLQIACRQSLEATHDLR